MTSNLFTATYNADVEDPYPSLSDFHDYEPNLEFDDSDLLQQKDEAEVEEDVNELELAPDHRVKTPSFIESPMSDGTIDEDFEAALGMINFFLDFVGTLKQYLTIFRSIFPQFFDTKYYMNSTFSQRRSGFASSKFRRPFQNFARNFN